MTRKLSRLVRILSLVLGLAVTLGAAAIGVVMLEVVQGTGCHYPKSMTERLRLKAVADATRQFTADQGRCPSGTAELAADLYLNKINTRGAYA